MAFVPSPFGRGGWGEVHLPIRVGSEVSCSGLRRRGQFRDLGRFAAADGLDEEFGEVGVELAARAALDLGQRGFHGESGPVWPVQGHCGEGVGYRHDPAQQRDSSPERPSG